MSTTHFTADDLRDDFIALRRAGHTYREIGAKFGISHERVRQVLTKGGGSKEFARVPAKAKRKARISEITAWLEENGPVARDQVLERFDISSAQLTQMISEGLPSHLILLPVRATGVHFTDEDVKDALVRAWAEIVRINPSATGMSHVLYERVRKENEPSSAMLVARFGWETVCELAGVPAGEAWRSKDSYVSRWSDEDILRAVRRYVDDSRSAKTRASYLGYERWQQLHDDAPSGTLVRNRMRVLGLKTWPETVAASMALTV